MLKEFYVTFKEDGFDAMTNGKDYLVTFNGCHQQSYRGRDDNGTAFCYSDDVFEALLMVTAQVAGKQMLRPALTPPGSTDYTHVGIWQGPDNIEMTNGQSYHLIYDSISDSVTFRSDLSNWLNADGCMFDVTHDFSVPGSIPNRQTKPKAPQAAVPVPVMHDDDLDAASWDDGCDMTGLEAIARDVAPVPEGPKSTEELRSHRYTPDLY